MRQIAGALPPPAIGLMMHSASEMLGLCPVSLLQIQQELFAPETAAVPPELAVLLNHPVTGNDDRDPVPPVGEPHRPLRPDPADPGGQLLVGDRTAVRES